MNAMLSDEELRGLLAEAAADFPVPDPVIAVPADPPGPGWRPASMRRWQVGAAAAVVVAGALVASAVLGGGGPGSFTDTAGEPFTRAPGSPLGYSSADGSPAVAPQRRAPTGTSIPGAGTSGGAAGVTSGGGTVVPRDDSRVVKTGSMSLAVDEGRVGATVARLEGLVTGLGGFVADAQTRESGEEPSAQLVVRVPVARFDSLVAQVRGLTAKVVSAQVAGKDVTAEYADTAAQIASLRAARSRYLDILARTRTIGETLTVQQRVDDVQRQIDRLEGQRRVLANRSELGTLTLSVVEESDERLATAAPSGWSRAWDDARDGFVGGLQSMLAGSGRALLLLAVGAVVLLLGRLGWRRAQRRLV